MATDAAPTAAGGPARPWALDPDTWLAQVVAWVTFGAVFAVAWHLALARGVRRVVADGDRSRPDAPLGPAATLAGVRRYAVALGAHTVATAWMLTVLGGVLVYVGASVVLQCARYLPPVMRVGAVLPLLDARALLRAVHPEHLAAHGVIAVAAATAPLAPAMGWLQAGPPARDAVLRVLFAVPLVALSATAVYGAACVGRAAGLV